MILVYFLLDMAHAVPLQLTQQGRLIDSNGAAITGTQSLQFRLYDDLTNGLVLYEETVSVNFNNGYYSAILGTDEINNPLDESVLSLYPLYLEIEVNSSGPLSPRQAILSTPYAQLSAFSTNLDGGTVNASQISIGGNLIIDSNGSWVGPTVATAWNDITGIPSEFTDGDNDTQLSESQVEDYIINGPINLATGTTLNGDGIVTFSTDSDTLLDISCTDGDVAKYDSLSGWYCDIDADALNSINCANGQTVVYDSNASEWTCAILADTLANTTCSDGEILSYDQSSGTWVCTSFNAIIDQDADGILAWNDCNDNDPTALSNVDDLDCDGVISSEDCDDNNPSSETIFTDADCDGVLDPNDCDDNDPTISAPDGSTASCAGLTCQSLLAEGQTATGQYYIDPSGTGAFLALCDMTTDGGGWTLVANMSFSDPNYDGWGNTQDGVASLSSRYILNFDVLPPPSVIMMRYEPNSSFFTVNLSGSNNWQMDGNAMRHPTTDGRYLTLTNGAHGTYPDLYCVVNGNYGYNCDGDNGHIEGTGMFNIAASNEFGNCGSSGWKVNPGGNSATVCSPSGYASLWFRE